MELTHAALLKLSVQRAMLGEVTGNLAALTVGVERCHIRIIAYFFTDPTDDDGESIECVATEVVADYTDEYTIETACHVIGNGILKIADFWAFARTGVEIS